MFVGGLRGRKVGKRARGVFREDFNSDMLTCEYLWTLEIFIWVQIARREGEIDTNQQEEQVGASPHSSGEGSGVDRAQRAHAGVGG